ncbi:hypothetical protein Vretimale_9057, partial [Volvox reticuliferus]
SNDTGAVSEPSLGTAPIGLQGTPVCTVPLLAINSRHRNPLPSELLPEITATAAAQYGTSPPYLPANARPPALTAMAVSSGLPGGETTTPFAAAAGMAIPAVPLAAAAPSGSPPQLTSSNGSSVEIDAVLRSRVATRRSLQPSEAFLSGKIDCTTLNGAGPVTHGSVHHPRVVAALQAAGLMANLNVPPPAPAISSDGGSRDRPSRQSPARSPAAARYRPSGKNTYQPTSAEVLLAKSIGMSQGTSTAAAAAKGYGSSGNVHMLSAATRELASADRGGGGAAATAGNRTPQSDRRLSSPPPLAAMMAALVEDFEPRVVSYSSSGPGGGYAPTVASVKWPSPQSPPPMTGIRPYDSGCGNGAAAAAAAAASGGMDALLERLAAEAFPSSPSSQTPSLTVSEAVPRAMSTAGGHVQGHLQSFVTPAAAVTTGKNDASGGGGGGELHSPPRAKNAPSAAMVDEGVREQLQQLQQQLQRVQEQVAAVLSG